MSGIRRRLSNGVRSLFGIRRPPAPGAKLLEEARLAHQEKRWADALPLWDAYSEAAPSDIRGPYNRVTALLALAQLDEAKSGAEDIRARWPDRPEAAIAWARTMAGIAKQEAATPGAFSGMWMDALGDHPANPILLAETGKALIAEKEFGKAEEILRRLQVVDKPASFFLQSRLLAANDPSFKEAVFWDAALRQFPGNEDFRYRAFLAARRAKIARVRGYNLFSPAYLTKLGFTANTIIDVGVRKGTPELYNAFPDATFILVDPQPGGEELLTEKPAHYKFMSAALGRRPGRLTLHESGVFSSIMERTELTARTVVKKVEVDVVTLDDLIGKLGLEGDIGLKIDTEGFELEVLGGLNSRAAQIEWLICEVSVRKRFVDGYTFSELVVSAHEKGFEFYNFLRSPIRTPKYYDCLFLRKGHPLFD
jgi:FkbM family methyltransferase